MYRHSIALPSLCLCVILSSSYLQCSHSISISIPLCDSVSRPFTIFYSTSFVYHYVILYPDFSPCCYSTSIVYHYVILYPAYSPCCYSTSIFLSLCDSVSSLFTLLLFYIHRLSLCDSVFRLFTLLLFCFHRLSLCDSVSSLFTLLLFYFHLSISM